MPLVSVGVDEYRILGETIVEVDDIAQIRSGLTAANRSRDKEGFLWLWVGGVYEWDIFTKDTSQRRTCIGRSNTHCSLQCSRTQVTSSPRVLAITNPVVSELPPFRYRSSKLINSSTTGPWDSDPVAGLVDPLIP